MTMVNMAKNKEELAETPMEEMAEDAPIYPYGLCICLTQDELEKLDLDSDCNVGDTIHLMAMAKVTSISKNETSEGENCRIELQITDLGLEDEDEEVEDAPKFKFNPGKFYKK